ncbi:MAG TPA: hypothetical protein VGB32_00720 [Candidatus Bathyarchaeia archaeon]
MNENQVLILSTVENRIDRITRILVELSESRGVPYSTLKFNAKVLKELGLLDYGTAVDPVDVRLTDSGRLVLNILREGVEMGLDGPAWVAATLEAHSHDL